MLPKPPGIGAARAGGRATQRRIGAAAVVRPPPPPPPPRAPAPALAAPATVAAPSRRVAARSAAAAPAAAAGPPAAAPAPPAAGAAAPPRPPLSFAARPGLYDGRGRLMLKCLTLPELEEWCESIGEDRRRAVQLWRWMYADDKWAGAPEDTIGLQNGFSPAFCEKMRPLASMEGGLRLEGVARARDGTRKLVFRLTEGEGKGGIEAVLIPVVREAGSKPRITLCVSSQVGCDMGCKFCLTGKLGLAANLSAAQITEQLVEARRLQAREGDGVPITNIVYMGMGEPLHNLEAVLASAEGMAHPLGLHVSHNKITVSTVGLVDRLGEFVARCSTAQLAVSLHATTDEIRDAIVPVNRRHDLSSLLGALAEHYPRGNPAKRRVLIEYVMLDGVNDSDKDAERLVRLLEPIEAKVNLIQFNAHEGTPFRRTPDARLLAFRSILIRGGRVCTIRDSRGDDQLAACGQLGDVSTARRPKAAAAAGEAAGEAASAGEDAAAASAAGEARGAASGCCGAAPEAAAAAHGAAAGGGGGAA
ncbi:dual-specificity RNA methyltransferase [Raphidocelis subcapitata]|uniref:Dual-specificity RNA methyltransferase n=1 Tax=Raphidocelis subcapitata TaxID=307507 RepID=A0A2V0NWU9_9CHLO|nr:dual-specificity RNA methyltransferase [Raphidocelis subcapitata]|eukprot:GBF92101.1 dual-specificity RNA methyltransferase [Raphidocelis subcapitata]